MNIILLIVIFLVMYVSGKKQGMPLVRALDIAKAAKLRVRLIKYIVGIYLFECIITYICFLLNFEIINKGIAISILNFLLGVFVICISCALNFLFFLVVFTVIDVFIKGLGYDERILALIFFPLDDKLDLLPATLIIFLNCYFTYYLWDQFIFELIIN